jgi:hypothetical protein
MQQRRKPRTLSRVADITGLPQHLSTSRSATTIRAGWENERKRNNSGYTVLSWEKIIRCRHHFSICSTL